MTEMQLPQPGPAHELLEPFVGTFQAEVKLYMGPGDPAVSTGVMVNEFQLNGLWLMQTYKGDAVEGPFPNFAGYGFWGWNFAAQKYEGFWVDSVSPAMQTESGSVDDTGRVWTMLSKHTNPQTGEPMTKKSIIELVDSDNHRMVVYFSSPDGTDFKSMEIHYTRV